VVILLYSTKFIAISEMIYWAAMGMFFKAVSWAIAFIFLAKGESKLYFWNELITNIYLLTFNIIGYYYWGLNGLGISFLITYIVYAIQVFIISKIKYNFALSKAFLKVFLFQFILAMLSFTSVQLFTKLYTYIIGSLLIVISTWYSFKELDKRMDIVSLLKKLKAK
jgi:O-antigen/teichoic acid export membrane protein